MTPPGFQSLRKKLISRLLIFSARLVRMAKTDTKSSASFDQGEFASVQNVTRPPMVPRSQRESAALVFIFLGFGLGKRVGRGALKLLKRPVRVCGRWISER